jgi:hypothetical protein
MVFYHTASAMAYGRRPKFVRAKHLATAEGENCTYGPTLCNAKLETPKPVYYHTKQLSKQVCKITQPLDFQSQFSTSKIIRIFLNFFFIEEYQFKSTFFALDIF